MQTERVKHNGTNDRLTHIYQDGTPEFRQKWDNLYSESDRLWSLVRAAELAWERHNEQIRIFEEGLL